MFIFLEKYKLYTRYIEMINVVCKFVKLKVTGSKSTLVQRRDMSLPLIFNLSINDIAVDI